MDSEKKRERFIKKAREKFGDKFDYSKVEYVNCDKDVCIICPEHGEFWQSPTLHLSSKFGCPCCGKKHQTKPLLGKEYIIKKSREKYGKKYDFSKFEYKGINEKSCIICPEHGEFWTTPQIHLVSKTGCPECGRKETTNKNTLSTETFIERAKKIHGDKYDYSKVDCHGWSSYVTIICPEHGEFIQRVGAHLKGAGCQKCADMSVPVDEFVRRFKNAHNKECNVVQYKNYGRMAVFHCEKHGDFEMKPKTFLKKGKCPYCEKEEKFIKAAREKHGDKYDYSKVVYKDSKTPVCIIDRERGEFWQLPSNHINGIGNNFPFDCYEYYKSIAEKYEYMYDFYKHNRRCFLRCKEKGFLKDFTWLKKDAIWEKKERLIYVYEFEDGLAYVGLTNNLKRRDNQHRGLNAAGMKWIPKNDSLYEYCTHNGIEAPEPKILETGLTIEEAQRQESYWIKEYERNKWVLLNKRMGGAIGPIPDFERSGYTIEQAIKIIKENFKSGEEVRRTNKSLYRVMIKHGLGKYCFPENVKRKPHNYTNEFIESLVKKYPIKNDLRKNDRRAYQYMWEHGLLDQYYPKRLNSLEHNFKSKKL